jgi:hypothetical protein
MAQTKRANCTHECFSCVCAQWAKACARSAQGFFALGKMPFVLQKRFLGKRKPKTLACAQRGAGATPGPFLVRT